jgi:hypothetical protein
MDPLVRLAAALADRVPDALPVRRGRTLEWLSPVRAETDRLALVLRDGGDLQLEYHVQGKRGTPFEVLWDGDPASDESILEEAVSLVADLLSERRVLAMHPGLFRGGRDFPTAAEVTGPSGDRFRWIVSWRGTYDRGAAD